MRVCVCAKRCVGDASPTLYARIETSYMKTTWVSVNCQVKCIILPCGGCGSEIFRVLSRPKLIWRASASALGSLHRKIDKEVELELSYLTPLRFRPLYLALAAPTCTQIHTLAYHLRLNEGWQCTIKWKHFQPIRSRFCPSFEQPFSHRLDYPLLPFDECQNSIPRHRCGVPRMTNLKQG